MAALTLSMLTARDVMPNKMVTLRPDQTVQQAMGVLVKRGTSSLPVVDGGQLVGVLSEWDCLKVVGGDRMANLYEGPDIRVDQVMSRNLRTIHADADLPSITHLFVTDRFHQVPVVDDAGRLLGQISRRDVLRGIQRMRRDSMPPSPYPDYRRPA